MPEDIGAGVVLAIVFLGGVFIGAVGQKRIEMNTEYTLELLRECEAELPRNQHCKLIATPEKADD